MVREFMFRVWHQAKASAAVFIAGILLLIGGLYESVAVQFYIGNAPVTATTYNSQCAPGAPFAGIPAQPGSCAAAATDVAAMQHFYTLGILALVGALYTGYYSLYRSKLAKMNAWLSEGLFWIVFWLITSFVKAEADRISFFFTSIVVTVLIWRARNRVRGELNDAPNDESGESK